MYESPGSQFSRTTTGVQSGPEAFDESRFVMTFLTILRVTEILYRYRLVPEGKTSKEISESLRLEFLEKFLVNNFALSDAEDTSSEALNTGGIADLPLSRKLLAIHQKYQEARFQEMIDSFVLLAYASLAASRTFLQRLLAFLNFPLHEKIYFVGTDEKSDFYELRQQHKQLKTMDEELLHEEYKDRFQPEPTHKMH